MEAFQHADQKDLLEWIGHFESNPRVFVIHGETTASEALARKIEDRYNLTVHVPKWKERLILKPREVTVEAVEAPEPLPDMREMLSNTIIDLESELKALKKRIKSKEAGEKIEDDDVDRLNYIQEELKEILS